MVDRWLLDVRLAVRGTRRSIPFTLTVILILGVGIGGAATMISVVDAVLFQPLPVTDQERLYQLTAKREGDLAQTPISQEHVDRLRLDSRTLTSLASFDYRSAGRSRPLLDGDRPIVLNFAIVSTNFFDVLGARPTL